MNKSTLTSPHTTTIRHANDVSEHFFTTGLRLDRTLESSINECLAFAEQHNALVAKMHVFYPSKRREEAKALSSQKTLPILWTESADNDEGPGGVFLHAVAGSSVQPILDGDRTVGAVYADASARYCLLSGIFSEADSVGQQTEEVFERLESILAANGFAYTDVTRTWFYNRDILGWYDTFNRVRTKFYHEHKIWDHLLPASTGIGANNPFDAATMVAAFAVQPTSPDCQSREVSSPLQGPAGDYGSSFSRAVLLDSPDHQRLTVSGTASIDREGLTVYQDDFTKQVAKTHEVVEALLKAQNFGWSDVVRGIAYFRSEEDFRRSQTWLKELPFPIIGTVNVVCRDDLLYELEINAVKEKPTKMADESIKN